MKFNERLKELRLMKGLTLKEASSALSLSLAAYANYEYGNREPSIEIIKRICLFYKVTSDYLIGLTDEF